MHVYTYACTRMHRHRHRHRSGTGTPKKYPLLTHLRVGQRGDGNVSDEVARHFATV